MLNRFYKTRLAPTPSGYLHAGNALNFLLTAALAKQSSAKLLLRIDDLDQQRYRPSYAEDVFDTLRFLKISWNEGPQNIEDLEQQWTQTKRLPLYMQALKKLRANNLVFGCTCSRTQSTYCHCRQKVISLDVPNVSWRLITDERTMAVQTLRGNTVYETLPNAMQHFIVRKKDGLPAYQLTSLVDDLHFGIDLIVRGQDLWPSTLAQHFLAQALGEERFAAIRFYHHPLLINSTGEKLSKSAGATSILHWRKEGRSVAELLAYISDLLHLPFRIKNESDLLAAFNL